MKNTAIEWDDGEKGNSNLILTVIFLSVHETYLKVLVFKKRFAGENSNSSQLPYMVMGVHHMMLPRLKYGI